MKSFLFILTASILVFGLFACNKSKKSVKTMSNTDENLTSPIATNETIEESEAKKLSALNDVYGVKTLNGVDVSSKGITIEFNLEESRISGNGGCNNYSGDLHIKEKKLVVGFIRATKMACGNLSTEQEFFQTVQKVNDYAIKKGNLILYSDVEIVIEAARID